MVVLEARKASGSQYNFYCMYCSRSNLLYLWDKGRLIGLGTQQWLFCPDCKRKYKRGIYGFSEQELEADVNLA